MTCPVTLLVAHRGYIIRNPGNIMQESPVQSSGKLEKKQRRHQSVSRAEMDLDQMLANPVCNLAVRFLLKKSSSSVRLYQFKRRGALER